MHESGPALRISLSPHVNAPNQARRHLRAMLRGRLPDLLEQRSLLLVSELTSVAVLHRRRSAVSVWIDTSVPWLRAEVTEIAVEPAVGSSGCPGASVDEAGQAVGLALSLVDCFATEWGQLLPRGYWFEVAE